MAAANSSKRPAKPYPAFPLFWHTTGGWSKKIRGKTYYFGKDATSALERYKAKVDGLHIPSVQPTLSVADCLNHFLTWKEASGSDAAFKRYLARAEAITTTIDRDRPWQGLRPADWQAVAEAVTVGMAPTTSTTSLSQIKHIVNWVRNNLGETTRIGDGLKAPTAREIRLHRAKRPKRTFTPDEITRFLSETQPPLKAFILLGVNCGLNPGDIGELEHAHYVDGWIRNFPRSKTGVNRKCWLWPETVEAIEACCSPKGRKYLFYNRRGSNYVPAHNEIGKYFRLYLKSSGQFKAGISFRMLRTTFRTVASGAMDDVAARVIMGHEQPGIDASYVDSISDERVKAVSGFVRNWCGIR